MASARWQHLHMLLHLAICCLLLMMVLEHVLVLVLGVELGMVVVLQVVVALERSPKAVSAPGVRREKFPRKARGPERRRRLLKMQWRIQKAKGIWSQVNAHVTVTNASAPSCLVKRAQGVDSLGIMCVPTNIMAPPQNAHAADDTVEATSDASCRVQVHFHCRIVPSHTHPRCQRATAKMSPWLCLATIVIEWIAQTNYRQARLKSGRANCCPGKMAFSLQDISSEGSGLHHSVPWLV
jgi:hypothetical protein